VTAQNNFNFFLGLTMVRFAGGKLSVCRDLMWIILFAFAARVAVRLFSGGDFWENGYTFFFALAQNIAAGNGVSIGGGPPTAFRVPLYPMFLATVTFGHQVFVPVLLAQSLIGAGTVLCAALIARELFGNTAAIIAAVLAAIYPYYVVHDTALRTMAGPSIPAHGIGHTQHSESALLRDFRSLRQSAQRSGAEPSQLVANNPSVGWAGWRPSPMFNEAKGT
jgi:hypothetical protein